MPFPADCLRLTSGRTRCARTSLTPADDPPSAPAPAGHIARTIAPTHVTGPYVKVLHAGDLLTPGRGRPDLAALEADPTLGRATSRALDRPPDGFPVDPE